MATYYKYAERQADSFVNWAEIGKDMTDMLANENKIREEKKAAIDKASREFGNVLSENVQGDHKGMNQWALEYANEAQQARLLQDKLLKSGQLKLKDYLVQRQNITDGTKQSFALMTEYQQEYKNKMERMKEDKSQDLEGWLMSEAEGFANFSQTKLYINPTDYSVAAGKMVKNEKTGVMELSKDPNDYSTVSALKNRIKGTFDKFDVPTTLTSFVDGLGIELNAIKKVGSDTRTGSISETLDITTRTNFGEANKKIVDNFEKAETKALQSYLTNPYNVSSVLTNSIKAAPNGEQYTFTWDPEKAKTNKNLILLKNDPKSGNPTPEFTAEQEKAALEHLRVQARLMYDKKEEIQAVTEPKKTYAPEYVGRKAADDKELVNTATMIGTLWGGPSGAEIKKATTAFRDINPNVQSVKRTPTGVTVTLIGPDKQVQTRELPFKGTDGKLMSQQDFIMSAAPLLGGNADWKTAVARGGFLKGAKFNTQAQEASEVTVPVSAKSIEVPLTGITQESEKASKVLKSSLPRGFTVEDQGGTFGNEIMITAPNGKQFPFTSKKGKENAAIIKADIERFVAENSTQEGQGEGTPNSRIANY
jgi:hypothetical protein